MCRGNVPHGSPEDERRDGADGDEKEPPDLSSPGSASRQVKSRGRHWSVLGRRRLYR